MTRAFTSDGVLHPEAAQRILLAANRAPSAGFSQGYALLVLDQPGQLAPFWELPLARDHPDPRFEPVTKAPLVIVPLSCKDVYLDRYARPDKGWTDRDEAHWPVPYWDIDTGFMARPMLLAAVDEGLARCSSASFLRQWGRSGSSSACPSSTCRSVPSPSGIPIRSPTRAARPESSSAGNSANWSTAASGDYRLGRVLDLARAGGRHGRDAVLLR